MRKTAGTLHFRMIQIKPAIKSKAQKQLELKENNLCISTAIEAVN